MSRCINFINRFQVYVISNLFDLCISHYKYIELKIQYVITFYLGFIFFYISTNFSFLCVRDEECNKHKWMRFYHNLLTKL